MLGAGIRTKELTVPIDPLPYTILRADLFSGMCTEACQLAEAFWEQLRIMNLEGSRNSIHSRVNLMVKLKLFLLLTRGRLTC